MSYDHQELLGIQKLLVDCAVETGQTLRDHYGNATPEAKTAPSDWVTYWDKWAQSRIIERLAAVDPAIGFIAEEDGVVTENKSYFTVDPIDGTAHFVRKNPFCTTQLGLVIDGEPVIGVVHDFVNGETYEASRGNYAFNGETRLRTSQRSQEEGYLTLYSGGNPDKEAAIYQRIEKMGTAFVQYFASGYTMASVARGGLEGVIVADLGTHNVWDFVPGVVLISEAGGTVANIGDTALDIATLNFIASNAVIHASLQSCFGE